MACIHCSMLAMLNRKGEPSNTPKKNSILALPGKILRALQEGMDHLEVSKIHTLLKILT